MYWKLHSMPISLDAPQEMIDSSGLKIPIVMIDDQNGNIYIGGKNYSKTWIPSGGGGLSLIVPTPTADPRIFELPKAPAILLLFRGNGSLQRQGIGNDFVLDGAEIALNYTPGPGETFQAVVG